MGSSQNDTKRNLFILAGPACLLQFLWYYYAVAEPAAWDVLVISYGGKKTTEKMVKYCQNSKLFENIIIAREPLPSLPLHKKVWLFLEMVAYFIVGQSKRFAKKYLEHDIDYDQYSEVVVESDETVITGCAIKLAKEKYTVLLEDGAADYTKKRKWCGIRNIFDFNQVSGMIIALMGYGTCVSGYDLKNYQYCVRYSTLPDRLAYRNYASINTLFDRSLRDNLVLSDIASLVFEVDSVSIMPQSSQVVLFTTAYKSEAQTIAIKKDGVYEAVRDWLCNEYGRECEVLIKKHPRDEYDYTIWDGPVLSFVDFSIPGELLIPFCEGKEVVLMFASTLMFQLEQCGVPYRVIFPESFVGEIALDHSRYLTNLFGAKVVVI